MKSHSKPRSKSHSLPVKIAAVITSVALLGSCSLVTSEESDQAENSGKSAADGMQRVEEGRISLEVPEDWVETEDFKPTKMVSPPRGLTRTKMPTKNQRT